MSFSCDDLATNPGEIKSVAWLPDGFIVEFQKNDTQHFVRFPGAPEDVLTRVADHKKMLVVGLRKGEDPFSPLVEVSEELALPNR